MLSNTLPDNGKVSYFSVAAGKFGFIKFVQIAEIDWFSGRQKCKFSKKMLKDLLRNHKMDEVYTLHYMILT